MNKHGLQITASPHLVQLAAAALLFRFQQGMRPHQSLQNKTDDFNRKGAVASSIFGMTRKRVSDARTFGCACRRWQTSMRFARRRYLLRSYACATWSCLAGFLANGGCVPAPSLCARENVPRANVQIVARPPTAGGQLCIRQIAHPLSRRRP